MATALFESGIFGPVNSRRFGRSLGLNLLPADQKLCNYNCVYCECGITDLKKKSYSMSELEPILEELKNKLQNDSGKLDYITLAGNGEPTLHPYFGEFVAELYDIRNEHAPHCKIALLTNATTIDKMAVKGAVKYIDECQFKLDAGSQTVFERINKPVGTVNLRKVVDKLAEQDMDIVIQSLFLRGEVDGEAINNTSFQEVKQWIEHLEKIDPVKVVIYSLDRDTAYKGLEQVSKKELELIAEKVRLEVGCEVQVF